MCRCSLENLWFFEWKSTISSTLIRFKIFFLQICIFIYSSLSSISSFLDLYICVVSVCFHLNHEKKNRLTYCVQKPYGVWKSNRTQQQNEFVFYFWLVIVDITRSNKNCFEKMRRINRAAALQSDNNTNTIRTHMYRMDAHTLHMQYTTIWCLQTIPLSLALLTASQCLSRC